MSYIDKKIMKNLKKEGKVSHNLTNLIETAVKTKIQTFYHGGLSDKGDNADEVLKIFIYSSERKTRN